MIVAGGYARISGTTGGLFIAAGGHTVLTGTCQGTAVNDGGELLIERTVTDSVTEHAGTTTIAATAQTGRQRCSRWTCSSDTASQKRGVGRRSRQPRLEVFANWGWSIG